MEDVILKCFEAPDGVREFEKGRFEIIKLGWGRPAPGGSGPRPRLRSTGTQPCVAAYGLSGVRVGRAECRRLAC